MSQMNDPSDSKKPNTESLNRSCDFCPNPADIFAFQVERGTFREFYFCSECASSYSPSPEKKEEKPKSVEDAFKRLKDQKISNKVGKMLESDFENEKAAKVPVEHMKVKGEKVRSDCFCCGTKRKQIIETGIFPCSYCFDSFPELESQFPDQFQKNLEDLEKMIKITELEDKIKEAQEFLENIPEEEKQTELYYDTVKKLKRVKKKLEKYRKNEE